MSIIKTIGNFEPHEQLMLLCSRYFLEEEERIYIGKLVERYDFNWDVFLGMVMLNRVNGVVYKNIKEFNNIPKYVKYFLNVVYLEQREREMLHQKEILKIAEIFEKQNIKYAFLKGSVLNTIFYEIGDRISNDTDILVDVNDIDKVTDLLNSKGYVQGEVREDELRKATKKEILFARLNTYEVVPFIKPVDKRYLPFHEIDINFRLSNDDIPEMARIMLADTISMNMNGKGIRTLSLEKFLIFLCIHHFREATMIYKIVRGDDLTLYKFMDIHFFIAQKYNDIDWNKVMEISIEIGRLKDVYYTLYYTEILYPGTVEATVLKALKPEDIDYLNEYKGRDNTSETYTWKTSFEERVFSNKRRIEAMKNIEKESNRFEKIRLQLIE